MSQLKSHKYKSGRMTLRISYINFEFNSRNGF